MPADPREATEARRWVERADRDVAAVERSLDPPPVLADIAAYHCQQAAEKLLKASIVLGRARPRRTHDLESLALEAVALRPELAPLVDPLRPRTTWGYAYRYPHDPALGEPEPTVEEIRAVLRQILDLRTAVLDLIGNPR